MEDVPIKNCHAAATSTALPQPPPRCRPSATLTRRSPAARCCRHCRAIPAALLPRCRRRCAATTGAVPPPLPPPPRHRRRAISAATLPLPSPSFLLLSLSLPPPRYCAATAGCRCRAIATAALPAATLPAAAAQPPRCCYENRVLWYLHTVLTYQSHVTSL